MNNHPFAILQNKNSLVILLLILAIFFSFYQKGAYDVQEWDEARNGVNAFEMLQNHDYVNLYYDSQPDTWNAKPPLMIWMIAGSYSLFGFNEFALRLPSALAALVFLLLCFKTISLLDKPMIAFLTCLVLLSCKALFGNHIGLTADFDCLLLVFLTASVYFFIRFIELGEKNKIFYVALFTGLAFYTKGPASFTIIPGFFLYLFLKKYWWVVKCWQTWVALAMLSGIVISWLSISKIYGIVTNQSFYGSKNAVEVMFFYDTFKRFTDPAFDITGKPGNIYLFFFEVIDARLNLWNYVFYLGVIFAIIQIFKSMKNKNGILPPVVSPMLTLSACLILPLALVLTFASSKNNWYLAPIFMYIAYIVVKTILFLGKKNKNYYFLAVLLFAFTFVRQIYYMSTLSTTRHDILSKNANLTNKKILVLGPIQQDVLLYLKWLNVKIVSRPESFSASEKILFIHRTSFNKTLPPNISLETFNTFDDYVIGQIKTTPDNKIITNGS